MAERIVKPEILDNLHATDTTAIRSRKDLRLINWFMRGEAWILKKLDNIENLTKIIEIGAGDGHLLQKIQRKFPNIDTIAIDLLERPNNISTTIDWQQGDVMENDSFDKNTIVIANLFIHHLDDEQLYQLGKKINHCRAIIMAEPHRYWFSKFLGYLLFPFINKVTKHDMIVSIDAGFRFGELAGLIDVDWHWDERTGLGGIRSIATNHK